VVTSTKACKNVSMANISNIRNISFISKYKLKFSICPKFLTELHFLMYCPRFENHRRELFSNVLNYNAAILSAEDKFVWILSNEDPCLWLLVRKRVRMFLWLIFLISEI
jgi:hypothetical protein